MLFSRKLLLEICLYVPLVTTVIFGGANGSEVPIKIVQEPASYGSLHPVGAQHRSSLTPSANRPSPTNVSGPLHLRHLRDHCYNLTDTKYRYVLCPFNNVSQYETVYRWNAYEGVLGIWKHWEIVNNTFVSMVYTSGDACGSQARFIKVYLVCGRSNKLQNVSEPSRCNYTARFESPHACARDSMLVYPTLDRRLQDRWDHLESQLRNREITDQGYRFWLEEIFVDAGLRQPTKPAQSVTSSASPGPAAPDQTQGGSNHFSHLEHCNSGYSELKREVEQLNEELSALKVLNQIKFKMPTVHP